MTMEEKIEALDKRVSKIEKTIFKVGAVVIAISISLAIFGITLQSTLNGLDTKLKVEKQKFNDDIKNKKKIALAEIKRESPIFEQGYVAITEKAHVVNGIKIPKRDFNPGESKGEFYLDFEVKFENKFKQKPNIFIAMNSLHTPLIKKEYSSNGAHIVDVSQTYFLVRVTRYFDTSGDVSFKYFILSK